MRNLISICAACDFPVSNHTNNDDSVYVMADGFKVFCPRSWDTIGHSTWMDDKGREFSDYQIVLDPDTNHYVATLVPDVSGTEAQSGSDLMVHRIATDYNLFGIGADHHDDPNHNPDLIELAKVDRWNDATYVATANSRSWVSTSVLGETEGEYRLSQTSDGKRHKEALSSDETITHEQRNAYVEGNDGFLSLHLLDEQLTKKYHAKLLNVFMDKNTGDVRIGSIRIIKNTDGTITARCVNNYCGPVFGKTAKITLNPSLATRAQMEDFVLAIISHGNNHAATWFRNRDTFYKVHKGSCDLTKCHPSEGTCTGATSIPSSEAPNEVEFLMEHQRYCKDSRCKCSERLSELVGDLAVDKHIVNRHIMASAS